MAHFSMIIFAFDWLTFSLSNTYHFVRPHESLTVRVPGKKTQLRSPAMAAGLTHKLWTVRDILKMPIMPALE